MSMYEKLYDDLANRTAKFYFGAVGIVIASLFSFVQWVLPLWWERQPNFDVSFEPNSNGIYIQTEPLNSDPEQCLVTGTVAIENEGVAPISIQNTHVFLIPFDVGRCPQNEENCVIFQNTPMKYLSEGRRMIDIEFKELKESHHHVTIYPVTHQHDLFSGSKATRAFSLLIPTSQLEKERLLVLAEQEFGRKGCSIGMDDKSWFKAACTTSRATINVPFPCQSKNTNK